jgi:hypothetical protein
MAEDLAGTIDPSQKAICSPSRPARNLPRYYGSLAGLISLASDYLTEGALW